jgi:hypothetical protein
VLVLVLVLEQVARLHQELPACLVGQRGDEHVVTRRTEAISTRRIGERLEQGVAHDFDRRSSGDGDRSLAPMNHELAVAIEHELQRRREVSGVIVHDVKMQAVDTFIADEQAERP